VIPETAASQDVLKLRVLIEERLAWLLPETQPRDRLNRSMRHSLLAPGKRLRPIVTLLTTEALGGRASEALDPACAIEMVHTASLIVDDLPCMDDAALRRGRRSSHSRFGVDVALLAAISLLNRAPMVISCSHGLDEGLRLRLIQLLSQATGDVDGLAAGQLADLEALPETTEVDQLREIVTRKTSALFVCAVESGARIAGASEMTVSSLRRFGETFGLAFQILDDVADLQDSAEKLRKDVGKDASKATHASLLGPERAAELAQSHADAVAVILEEIGLANTALARLTAETLAMTGAESHR